MRVEIVRLHADGPPVVAKAEVALVASATDKSPPMHVSELKYGATEWPEQVLKAAKDLMDAVERVVVDRSGLFADVAVTRDPSILDAVPGEDDVDGG